MRLVILFSLLCLNWVMPAHAQSRCNCDSQEWEGDCIASARFKSNEWIEIKSNTKQCSTVLWYTDEFPHTSIVTEGLLEEEWLATQEAKPTLRIDRCKICRDANYTRTGPCSYPYVDLDGDTGTYTGQCRDGKAQGAGTVVYDKGDNLQGEFQNGQPHGQLTLDFASGSQYQGEFQYGKLQGQGTWVFADGIRYQGEFQNGKKHGQGTQVDPDGARYQGEWQNGTMQGQGTFFADGDRQVGHFQNGQLWNGTIYRPNGHTCEVKNHQVENISEDCPPTWKSRH